MTKVVLGVIAEAVEVVGAGVWHIIFLGIGATST